MTISEWLLVMQTLILAATGVVVVWYTWETRLIRLETARQNLLVSKQLEIVLEKELRDQRKALLRAQPVFADWGGSFSGTTARLKVRNGGAPASDLEVRPLGEFTVDISPTFAKSGQEVQVRLDRLAGLAQGQNFGFVISYTDSLGIRREKIVQYVATERRFVEEGPNIESS